MPEFTWDIKVNVKQAEKYYIWTYWDKKVLFHLKS